MALTADEPPGDDPLDALVAAILAALAEAHAAGEVTVPIPRLRQQLDTPLSLLMRTLSALVDAELVEMTNPQSRNPAVALTEAGLSFARASGG